MIWWLTGNTGAGKTTLAKKMADSRTVILDGNDMRDVWDDWDLTKEGRTKQGLRTARLAKVLESQGHPVIVAVICPYEELRKTVKEICNCQFIYLPYGKESSDLCPYEVPVQPDFVYRRHGDK